MSEWADSKLIVKFRCDTPEGEGVARSGKTEIFLPEWSLSLESKKDIPILRNIGISFSFPKRWSDFRWNFSVFPYPFISNPVIERIGEIDKNNFSLLCIMNEQTQNRETKEISIEQLPSILLPTPTRNPWKETKWIQTNERIYQSRETIG